MQAHNDQVIAGVKEDIAGLVALHLAHLPDCDAPSCMPILTYIEKALKDGRVDCDIIAQQHAIALEMLAPHLATDPTVLAKIELWKGMIEHA